MKEASSGKKRGTRTGGIRRSRMRKKSKHELEEKVPLQLTPHIYHPGPRSCMTPSNSAEQFNQEEIRKWQLRASDRIGSFIHEMRT